MFRQSHRIILREEGENDGLVSVDSSKWGTYKGTLKDVSHLDMINWSVSLPSTIDGYILIRAGLIGYVGGFGRHRGISGRMQWRHP